VDKYEIEIKAIELAAKIENANGDLLLAYKQFEVIKSDIEKVMPLEAIIPSTDDSGIGMALNKIKDGEDFWKIYSTAIRNKLCNKNDKLYTLMNTGLSASAGAIATSVTSMLALPPAAVGLAIPIAAILATTGLEAFCKWTQEKDNDR
jgi:hypothetical protein